MTDPLIALILFISAVAMVIVVIGGGVWMSVRASNADHAPVKRTADPEPLPAAAPLPAHAPLAS